MGGETELIVIISLMHVFCLVFAALMLWQFMRTEPHDPRRDNGEDQGGGGGGGSRTREPTPEGPGDGGVPLPDAVPARVRLRGPGRLADLLPSRERRPVREPSEPARPGRVPAGR